MSQIHQSISQLQSSDANIPKTEQQQSEQISSSPGQQPPPPQLTSVSGPDSATATTAGRRSFLQSDLNPPEVQRYVVEHVVRRSDTTMHATQRLKSFSSKVPRPNQEVDYDTWWSSVELVILPSLISNAPD